MKRYIAPLVISFILIISGLIMSIYDVSSLTVIDDVPTNYESKEIIYTYDNNKNVDINYENVVIIGDEDIDEIKIIISYYEEYNRALVKETFTSTTVRLDVKNQISYKISSLLNEVVDNLKNRELYNYAKLYGIEVTVYVNPRYIRNIETK